MALTRMRKEQASSSSCPRTRVKSRAYGKHRLQYEYRGKRKRGVGGAETKRATGRSLPYPNLQVAVVSPYLPSHTMRKPENKGLTIEYRD